VLAEVPNDGKRRHTHARNVKHCALLQQGQESLPFLPLNALEELSKLVPQSLDHPVNDVEAAHDNVAVNVVVLFPPVLLLLV